MMIGRMGLGSVLLVLAAAGALAADIETDAELQELFTGGELRTSEYPDTWYFSRSDVWLFDGRGAVTANYAVYVGQPDGNEEVHMTAHGRWDVSNGTLCVQWDEKRDAERRCYRVGPTTGNQYGPHMFRATDVATGKSWKFALDR